MATYFISDLHLSAQAPEISQRFIEFIDNELGDAKTLYILGDLFEYWIGDDAAEVVGMSEILAKLKSLTDNGVNGFFIAGNRDFLVGTKFVELTGFTVLNDFTTIDLYGTPTLLLHGDVLCTDDEKHMMFREQIMTNIDWHAFALQKSVADRIAIAQEMRSMSADHKKSVSESIMDVNELSVVNAFEEHNVLNMIHGHTHRPKIHTHPTQNGDAERIVLGDWYTQLSYLKVDENQRVFKGA